VDALPETAVLSINHRSSFCAELSDKDLNRLRSILRRLYKHRTKGREMSDYELDKWIESVGERTRQKTIKQAVDRRLVE
jgi:hypothetical protein